jgi:hypothetical protein
MYRIAKALKIFGVEMNYSLIVSGKIPEKRILKLILLVLLTLQFKTIYFIVINVNM